ncbi:MAG: MerR family transcriptional regulator [Acidobacteriota bacterium]
MDETWTFPELVSEAAARIAALPAPKNGQIRAVPDERTVRYYATIGLLDRPVAQRGRTALYGRRHLAQIVSIKRLQGAEHSLADIRRMWPTLDDFTLERMSGVTLTRASKAARRDFWKREPLPPPPPPSPSPSPSPPPSPPPSSRPLELRVELTPDSTLVVAVPGDASLHLSPADVRALRAAAAPLVTELAHRGLIARVASTLEEP